MRRKRSTPDEINDAFSLWNALHTTDNPSLTGDFPMPRNAANGTMTTTAMTYVPAMGNNITPAIEGLEKRETPFYQLSKMNDGDAIQGVIIKADYVSFGQFDANANEITSDAPRYRLTWPGTGEFVFMGNSQVAEKAGDVNAGDYVFIRRVKSDKTRAGYSVINVDVYVAKKGTYKLPALSVATESSE